MNKEELSNRLVKHKKSLQVSEEFLSIGFLPVEYSNKSIDFHKKEIQRIEKALKRITSIKLKRSAFKYLISSKRREEVMGDLIETNVAMENEGFPRWKIKMIMYFNMATVLMGLWRTRLSDFGRAKKNVVDQ